MAHRKSSDLVPINLTGVTDPHTLADALNDSTHPRREEAWTALDGAIQRAGWNPETRCGATKDEVLQEILDRDREPLSVAVSDRDLILDLIDASEDFLSRLDGTKSEHRLPDGTLLYQREARELRLLLCDSEPVCPEAAEAAQELVEEKLAHAPRRVRDAARELSGTRSLEMRAEGDDGFGFIDANGDRGAFIAARPARERVTYFDVLGREHRVGGPAVIAKDRSFHMRNGRFHSADGPQGSSS